MKNPVLASVEAFMEVPRPEEQTYVTLNTDPECIEEAANMIRPGLQKRVSLPPWNFPPYPPYTDEHTTALLFLGNAINACYHHFSPDGTKVNNKFTTTFEGKEYNGSNAMWASLRIAYEKEGPVLFDAERLEQTTEEDIRNIFQGNPHIPLTFERAKIFRELGRVARKWYDGDLRNVVEKSIGEDGKIHLFGEEGFVERVIKDFPSFQDEYLVDGVTVRIDKRAQLLAGMLCGRYWKIDERFHAPDLEEITIYSNYQHPMISRSLGLATYNEDLAERVDTKTPIIEGTLEEIYIRAHPIIQMNAVTELLNEEFEETITNAHIDAAFFLKRNEIEGQHHLCITTRY